MAKYLKITNEKENHYGFQYKDGLNVLNEPFNPDPEETCGPGGLYITDSDHIHLFYDYGCWVREIELPFEDPDFKMVRLNCGQKYRVNKLILNEKWPLFTYYTIRKFKLKVNLNFICCAIQYNQIDQIIGQIPSKQWNTLIDYASKHGDIKVLNWWVESNKWRSWPSRWLSYTHKAIDGASEYGQVKVLDWWLNSDFELKYTHKAIDKASINGHVDVLNWWKSKDLKLKYTSMAIDLTVHPKILDWWVKSELMLRYTDTAMNYASRYVKLDILDWWLKSDLTLKYSSQSVDYAGNFSVLEWWVTSKLPIKYTNKLIVWSGRHQSLIPTERLNMLIDTHLKK